MGTRDYAKKIISLLITRGAGIVLSFIVSIYIARLYGADTTGKYYLFISLIVGLSVVSNLGFNSSLIKYCAHYSSTNEKEYIRGYWHSAFRLSFIVSSIITAIILLIIIIEPFPNSTVNNYKDILIYVSAALIPFTLLSHNIAVLIGLNKQNTAAITDKIAPPLLFLILSGILYLTSPNKDYILLVYTISIIIVFIISTWLLSRTLYSKEATHKADRAKLLSTSKPILTINIANFVTDWGATYILAIYGTLQQIGVYNIGWRLVTIMAILVLIFNNINAPRYSRDFKRNDLKSIEHTARQTSTILFLIGLPIIIIIFIFAENIMSLFGDDFVAGAPILQILAIGQLFNFSTGSVGYLLLMTGHEKQLKRLTIYICIAQIAAMLIFIPAYDIYAAALITTVAIIIKSLASVYIAHKHIGVLSLPILKIKNKIK